MESHRRAPPARAILACDRRTHEGVAAMPEQPSEREWILLNPGPANTTASVRRALLTPDLCHREPEFFEVMRDCRERLVRVAGCAPDFAAVLFTGSGTAAVEAV